MAHPNKLPEDKVRQILELKNQGLSFAAIGRELGIAGETCRRYYKNFTKSTDDLLPEFTQKPGPPPKDLDVLEVDERGKDTIVTSIVRRDNCTKPAEFKAKAGLSDAWIATHFRQKEWQGYYKLKDGSGHNVVDLQGSSVSWKRIIGEELKEAILAWTTGEIKPAKAPTRRIQLAKWNTEEGYAVSWGLWDAHIGMYAFGKEVGTDYDVNMAYNRCLNSVDDMIAKLRLYKISKIWMPLGNDYFHYDNVRQTTSGSDIVMDTDSRFGRVYRAGTGIMEYMVRRATELAPVEVFYVPGNHDVLTSYTLVAWLKAWFRNDPRVTVSMSENPQQIRAHGGTTIMFEHGKNIPPARFPLIFDHWAAKNGIDLNTITYREVQLGHKHEKRVREYQAEIPTNGISIITNPALCSNDHFHHTRGFIGAPTKSVEARMYDKLGLQAAFTTWARDDERKE